jgi:hypothetical protein
MKQRRRNIWIVLLGILLMMSVISAAQGFRPNRSKEKDRGSLMFNGLVLLPR